MKKDVLNFASRLSILVLAMLVLGLTSCSKSDDDGDDDGNRSAETALRGDWVQNVNGGVIEISFYDGSGWVSYPTGWEGTFSYIIYTKGHISYKMKTWHPNGNVQNSEGVWLYHIDGDKMTLDGEHYTRKK